MQHHGEATLLWEESILIVEARGPFNEEGMYHVFENIKKAVLNKKLDRWQKLSICDKETLGSPSTLKLLNEINVWCTEQGCEKMAVVICTSLQHFIAEHQLKSASKIFFEKEEAKQWLIEQPISNLS
ncbi:MAG: hypothetical protein NWQ54_04355 [Paraglaciecola sp.]|uniref:hypothetical protein n=1 Tax=Paraglaciecola sp. TaxID=1920173 RepID=UPI0027401BDA|nr:hypothetical protein [Paraglaciecola sp.]MDP5032588.1 hypothetical protein [Paraglaciecola sp.]MDP5130088.1 hypothetical protein [Paraglaciecola sp.]